jgi:hypothetical protein
MSRTDLRLRVGGIKREAARGVAPAPTDFGQSALALLHRFERDSEHHKHCTHHHTRASDEQAMSQSQGTDRQSRGSKGLVRCLPRMNVSRNSADANDEEDGGQGPKAEAKREGVGEQHKPVKNTRPLFTSSGGTKLSSFMFSAPCNPPQPIPIAK